MAERPSLHIAVAGQKSKASEYNDNFDMMMDYTEEVCTEAKNYVDETLAGNVFYRILGETIFSLIPLGDSSVHLLDGSLISASGSYADFVTYIGALSTTHPNCFCTEAQWQAEVAEHGVCGKFVYTAGVSVRLPKITGIVEGTLDVNALGDFVAESLPNIKGTVKTANENDTNNTGAFASSSSQVATAGVGGGYNGRIVSFDASRSSSAYQDNAPVQPNTIKGFYYIVIATATKTDIEVDIDEIVADLALKADKDLSNIDASAKSSLSDISLPSDTYIDLTWVNNTDYIAPANGYYTATINSVGEGGLGLYNKTTLLGCSSVCNSGAGNRCMVTLPVKVGQTVHTYLRGGTVNTFRFIYAEGEQ